VRGVAAGSAVALVFKSSTRCSGSWTSPKTDPTGVADLFPVLGHPELTCWEPLDWDDERLPGRQRRVDLGRDWPLPGSATSRWVTALAGGPVSASCGRKPRHSTPVMTRRCARSTTRACAPWKLWSGPPGH